MTRPTDADWSWFDSATVEIRRRRRGKWDVGWVATMPMSCPRCGIRWSEEGFWSLAGQVRRGWSAPPSGVGGATVTYTCRECGHKTYKRRDV